jgi:hypothetical protein
MFSWYSIRSLIQFQLTWRRRSRGACESLTKALIRLRRGLPHPDWLGGAIVAKEGGYRPTIPRRRVAPPFSQFRISGRALRSPRCRRPRRLRAPARRGRLLLAAMHASSQELGLNRCELIEGLTWPGFAGNGIGNHNGFRFRRRSTRAVRAGQATAAFGRPGIALADRRAGDRRRGDGRCGRNSIDSACQELTSEDRTVGPFQPGASPVDWRSRSTSMECLERNPDVMF